MVKFISEYQVTGFPFPPLTVFAIALRSKSAVPFPLSQLVIVAGLASGRLATVKSIASIGEVQFPAETIAYIVVVTELNGEAIELVPLIPEYQETVFPFPPLTVFSKVVKSKFAIPLPSSQRVDEAVEIEGTVVTFKSIATVSDKQFPLSTIA